MANPTQMDDLGNQWKPPKKDGIFVHKQSDTQPIAYIASEDQQLLLR